MIDANPDDVPVMTFPADSVCQTPRTVGRVLWPALLGVGVGVVLFAFLVPACSRQRAVPTSPTPISANEIRRATQAEGEPAIRVRIERGTERIEMSGPVDVTLVPFDVPSEIQIVRTPVEITLGDKVWVAVDGAGVRHQFRRGGTSMNDDALRISAVGVKPLQTGDFTLPGDVYLHARADISPGQFDVVEHVPIESYLPGVIAKELYPNWAIETFKAQSIAARSYALHERQRRLSLGDHFVVAATTQDQVYGGATTHPVALRAVRETSGIVLTHRGEIIRAYYSSTCGGRAASARDIWPTGKGFEFNLAAPIQAHERDHYCMSSKRYRWSTTRDRAELTARIRAYGKEHGRDFKSLRVLQAIEVARWNEVGRPARYRIIEGGGRRWELSAEQLRLACNQHVAGLEPIRGDDRVFSGDLEFEVRTYKVLIRGRGFGHGVGMCQFGAQGMSARGRQASDIVLHFYPGASLERAY